ncbi:MAG: pyridoxal phosphate-dependent aminotransferase, partial [Parasporobacterium sp.]|nr:pyridoxal phosphate-dependent aminotransferase [Parasporobacterium sp.]
MNTSFNLNKYLDLVEPSRSVTLLARLRQLQKEDPSILNLSGGEPDFDTPRAICDEVYRQLLAGCTHYGDSKGDPELRAAVSEKLTKENNAPYPADNIL